MGADGTAHPAGKSGGGKRTVIMREVVNGLMYVLSTGCQWRAIPTDLPPKSTVYDYFDLWTYDGTLQRIHHALYEQCREQAQREAVQLPPSSIAKREKRRKRGVCIDARIRRRQENQGQEAACSRRYIRPAASRCCPSCNVQDRDGAILVMATCSGCFPFFKSCSPTVAIRGRNSAPR